MTNNDRRLFVLDTNVLMHDPSALFRFQEHDLFIPMMVLEELDRSKKGASEVARNVRQASRFLDDLFNDFEKSSFHNLESGIPLNLSNPLEQSVVSGHLFFQTEALNKPLPSDLPGDSADNHILAVALELQTRYPKRSITLVSKDINLRLKAKVINLHAEDYYNDQVLDDADLLPIGFHHLPQDFWDSHSQKMEAWKEEGRSFYRITGPLISDWRANEFLYLAGEQTFQAIVREIDGSHAIIETAKDFSEQRQSVWGIQALNLEQNFAFNLLTDPNIDFVTLLGVAGTGKTLLALAAGLAQVLDDKIYKEIIVTRVTVPVADDIGFLPGTEEEKMTPWMGALMDNLEVLAKPSSGGNWGRDATDEFLMNKIKIRSLNFMRGRTFLNRYIIVDEAQNLTSKQMKTLITRAGPGSKIICLGNIAQIDTPYLTETSSGLTYVVDRFKHWNYSGHITLQRGERSRLADFASERL